MKTKMFCSLAATLTAACAAGYFATATHGERTAGDTNDFGMTAPSPFAATGGEQTASVVPGFDVAVSRLGMPSGGCGNDNGYYGTYDPGLGAGEVIRAFALASTSCNVGTQTGEWIDSHSGGTAGRHPIIAQNAYRLLDGRFEQIGSSWLKHSFCAVSEPTCGSCQPTGCGTLGIGCADTYWAGLNAAQGDLGPRSQINPWPTFPGGSTHTTYTAASSQTAHQNASVRGRMQIRTADITGGGQFFTEVQYVTHDEPYLNRYNNASWRPVNMTTTTITNIGTCQPDVRFQEPALFAWQDADPGVVIKAVDAPNDGRYHLGYRVYDNGDGTWDYEYALHNLNSARGAASFSLPIDPSVTVTNVGFHDVDRHTGEHLVHGNDDWTATEGGGALTWATEAFTSNPNANYLGWGNLYNFRFTADTAPEFGAATIGLFEPAGGNPNQVNTSAMIPSAATKEPCFGDIDGNGEVNVDDLVAVVVAWGTNDPNADINGSGTVDVDDLVGVVTAWGPCEG